MHDLSDAQWRKSSRSGGDGGNCVEVATDMQGVVAVRDTKGRDGGTLLFTPAGWRAFIDGIKEGDFDL
ncbi:DUF397 domain-containing protein [Actinoplanes derwentensis]|uniref:DUF397 domain-containing protein n=1 Tax=Actinoplanes derwentensis TaxID=113562 RepID=A0A1H2CDS7_9ACTN|nr:DUF397 domain-containing protein [Actinoplanes derwentensis]GID87372.1 hypothetical protein Ade03nite_62960 [Actinoplanes derwentensis]SDT68494.1 protein of unknown function [Actinoplanes derwentensis]